MDVEELVGVRGSLENAEKERLCAVVKRRGNGMMYALVINPANSSLNRRTQHFMQPNVPIIHLLRNYLWIRHTPPPRHPSDPQLSTNVLSQNVVVEVMFAWSAPEEH